MKTAEIVKILEEIADLLDLKGENVFKSRAYQKAARSLEFYTGDIEQLTREGRLREIPGIGEAIAAKITELVTSGHLQYYDKLRAEFPPGISTLLDIPGIGPRTAFLLAQQLKITTVDELEKAVASGQVAALPRMGEKTAQNILQQIKLYRKKKNEQRVPLGSALPVAESLVESLKLVPHLENATLAGSLRRFRDTIGDIDILAISRAPAGVLEAFSHLPQVREVREKGPAKVTVIAGAGLQVDFRLFDPAAFGSALQYATGSKQHNIDLRTRAEHLGLSLSEYGITVRATGVTETFADEESFYQRQDLQFIPPEIREGTHEIELAAVNRLPALLELSDIRGDLHVHTDWSDGLASLPQMVQAARQHGYEYICITDHSQGLGIARGLDKDRVLEQIRIIRELNRSLPGIQVLTGMEVNIRADGSLDADDEVLSQLDIVLASVHSGFNQSADKITRRVITALQNPHVDILAHPTGRLLGERAAVELDFTAVCQTAAEYRTALEINALPSRLDLKDTHIYQAREMGVPLVIGTDAHRTQQLDFMRYGVKTARRGWCQAGDVLNTLSWTDLKQRLKNSSSAATD